MLNNNCKNTLLLIVVALVLTSACHAESIYAKRSTYKKAVYSDDTARKVGDLITIIILEDSKTDNKVNRDLSNTNSRSSSFDGDLNIDHILPSIPGFTMEQESSRNLKGKADFKDERTFEDRVTVVVEDIMPNGNLVVIGSRTRDVAGDKQTIQVSGIIRPTDVSFTNTILSQQVANFKLVTVNEGVSKDYNDPGWLAGIFDFLWPF